MMHDDLFAGLRATAAPEELRSRVHAAAVEALAAASPSIWDRLWESRPLRVAWVGATIALVAAHVALSGLPGSAGSRSTAAVTREQSAELRRVLALPRVEISPRAERIALGTKSQSDKEG